MAEKAIQEGKTYIDPMFYIPEGTVDFTSSDTGARYVAGDVDSPDEEGDALLASTDPSYEIVDDTRVTDNYPDTTSELPTTPEILGVISQTTRAVKGGTSVVDVVLDVTGPAGALYRLRITKI